MKTKITFSILGLILLLTVGIFSSCNSTENVICNWVNEELDIHFNSTKGFVLFDNDTLISLNKSFEFPINGDFEIEMLAVNEKKEEYITIITGKNTNMNQSEFVNELISTIKSLDAINYTSEKTLMNNQTYDILTLINDNFSETTNHILITEKNNTIIIIYYTGSSEQAITPTKILSMFK